MQAAGRQDLHPTVSPGAGPPHEVALSNQEYEAVPSSNRALHLSNGVVPPQPQLVQGRRLINCWAGAGDPRVTVLGYWHWLALSP